MGNELSNDYAETSFMDGTKAIIDTIHRNKLLTFQKQPEKPKRDYELLKQNTALVSQLFLSIQSRRDADMGECSQYENQKDLLKCLPQTVSKKPSG